MKPSIIKAFAVFFALAVSLSGCGNTTEDDAGLFTAGKQVTSKGAIEKFGSITVNGVEFSTKGATLFLPDDTATPQRVLQTETQILDDKLLKLGMVVTIKGVVDNNGTTGTAAEIEFRDTLKAKIDDNGVDLVNNTITVMGQKIALDDKIKPLLASLNPGDVVQVSGLPDDKGGLRATFIEKKDLTPGTELEIKGFVSNASGSTFTLLMAPNATTGITVTLPAGAALPANGSFIEVKADAASPSGGAITATRTPHVEDINVNPTPATPGVQVSIEGFPSSIDLAANTLALNGRQVKFDQSQIFVGSTAGTKNDLAITKKIQAEGVIDANGVLNATKIVVKVAAHANPTISKGEIERSGGVVVNGVEFRTTGAVLHLPDDKTARVLQTETEIHGLLKPGMIITVKGGLDDVNGTTGVASEIKFSDTLEGKIDSVDDINKTITVMGQTVMVEDNVTRLNDDNAKIFSTAGFLKDDIVEVSGFIDDNGGLRATRVAKKAAGELEVKGFVVSIGSSSFGLSLKAGGTTNLTVNFAGTLPTVGQFVEIKSSAAPVNSVVTATAVQLEDRLGDAAEKVEVEGIVTSVTADGFMINGKKVIIAASTLFEGGLKTDLAAGLKIEAEGPLNSNGDIAAVKVMFRGNIKIEADASGISASSLTVLGKQVAINQFTRIDNGFVEGSHVEVRAYLDRNGKPVASRIVLKAANKTRTFLQGPVILTGGAMTILGTTVTTNASSQFRISTDQLVADQSITSAVFLAKVKSGVTVVKVRWATSDTSQPVEEAEIQLGSM